MNKNSEIIKNILLEKKDVLENKVFSPASLLLLLSIVKDFVVEEEQIEINIFLKYFDFDRDSLLQSIINIQEENTIICTNSSIWYDENYTLKERESLGLEVMKKDVGNPAILKEINKWVDEQTKGLIKEINVPFPFLVYVLINTIYLKCTWQEAFHSPIFPSDFRTQNGRIKKVGMLSKSYEEEIGFIKDKQFDAISLPYSENKLKFEIYLPSENLDLEKFINSLETINLYSMSERFDYSRNYAISFPKFEISSFHKLSSLILEDYLPKTFGKNKSIFTKEDIEVGHDLYQNAVIKVNEKGTEAAAVTFLVGVAGAAEVSDFKYVFIADRPFLFLIRDSESNSILFTGTLVEPPSFKATQHENEHKGNWLQRTIKFLLGKL